MENKIDPTGNLEIPEIGWFALLNLFIGKNGTQPVMPIDKESRKRNSNTLHGTDGLIGLHDLFW